MIEQPIVYMTTAFFKKFCRTLSLPYEKIQQPKQNVVFLEELIFQRGAIFIDLSDEDILELVDTKWESIDCDAERQFYYCFQKLLLTNKVRSCIHELEAIRRGDCKLIKAVKHKPHFLLLDESEFSCKQLQDTLGFIVISSEYKTEEYNVRFGLEIIREKEQYDLERLLDKVSQANSIIIEDPYLHKQSFEDFISKLLFALKREALKNNPFHVILLIQDHAARKKTSFEYKSGRIKPSTQTEIDEFNTQFNALVNHVASANLRDGEMINIEVYKTNKKMHDRSIYANTYWITCESGFCKSYKSPAKWNFHPIGLYFSEYRARLKKCIDFLPAVAKNSANPILQV